MSRKRPLVIALALATTSASLVAVAAAQPAAGRLHRVPVGRLERAGRARGSPSCWPG